MLSRLKRPSGLLFLFFVVLSMSIFFLSVRRLYGEDSGVSGGAQGSTSIVTGTKEECKEPSSSTEECITHVCENFVLYKTEPDFPCTVATRDIVPKDNERYWRGQHVSFSLTEESGEDKKGKKKEYYRCVECLKDQSGTPKLVDHETEHFPPPEFKWEVFDCDAFKSSDNGNNADFDVRAASISVDSSYIKFFNDPKCTCKDCSLEIPSFYRYFTVIEILILFAETDSDIVPNLAASWEGYTETLLVPYEKNMTVAISAFSNPSDANDENIWPPSKPLWSTPEGKDDKFDFPVPTPGEYTITAEC